MFGLIPFRSGGLDKRRDPWDIDSIFENFFHDSMFPVLYPSGSQMKVDIKENNHEFVIEADLPGVKKDEINLEIDENRLTIAVNRNEEINEENGSYIRRERKSSAMSRSFAVHNVVPEDVKAKFENGVLTITLPKKEQNPVPNKKIAIE